MANDASSMFDRLAQGRQKPSQSPVTAKKGGKRSDPDYIQVGAYIPRALNKQVKRHLLETDQDFSELVGELLAEWVIKQQSD